MEILSKYDITLRLVKVSRPPGSSKAGVVLFLDLTGEVCDADEILGDIRRTQLFERVELIRPIKDGLIVDEYSFSLLFLRERTVLMRRTSYEILLKRMREEYGTRIEAVLYLAGFKIGYNAFRDL